MYASYPVISSDLFTLCSCTDSPEIRHDKLHVKAIRRSLRVSLFIANHGAYIIACGHKTNPWKNSKIHFRGTLFF